MNNDSFFQVAGDPHPWPKNPVIYPKNCALIVIDMQYDYCTSGFYMDKAGYDINRLRKVVKPIKQVLSVARNVGMKIIYTRFSCVSNREKSETSYPSPSFKEELGWEVISELKPESNEPIIDKSTSSAFVSGEIQTLLQNYKVKHLVFCGNTIDVCVRSTLRSAVDLSYECVLLDDCCGAVNDNLYKWALESIKVENGVFGTVSNSLSFIKAFNKSLTV